jgi:hypothetical protein
MNRLEPITKWQTWRRDLKDFAPRLFQSVTASQ